MNKYLSIGTMCVFIGSILVSCRPQEASVAVRLDVKSADAVTTYIRQPDYTSVPSGYQAPSMLLADKSGNQQEASSPVINANGDQTCFVSKNLEPAPVAKRFAKIYCRAISTNGGTGTPTSFVEVISIRPAITLPGCGTNGPVTLSEEIADGDSFNPLLSYDGRKVAFFSKATNLAMYSYCDKDGKIQTASSNPSGALQAYLFDRDTRKLTLVSGYDLGDGNRMAGFFGVQGPPADDFGGNSNLAISGDGNVVAFVSKDDQLVTQAPWKNSSSLDVLVFNAKTKKTGWVSYRGPRDLPDNIDKGSDESKSSAQPVLNKDGQLIAFASDVRLLPTDINDVADVYYASFQMTPDGPDVGRRADPLQLVSTNANSASSTSQDPSYNPTMDSTGNIIAWQSTKDEFLGANSYPAHGRVTTATGKAFRIYVRNMALTGLESKISLVSAALMKDLAWGSKTWGYTQYLTSARNPVISPNGLYVTYQVVGADDQFLTRKMKDYVNGAVVVPTYNTCMNLLFNRRFSDESILYTIGKKESFIETPLDWGTAFGGFKSAVSTKCIPGIYPNAYKSWQTYRATLNSVKTPIEVTELVPAALTPVFRVESVLQSVVGKPDEKTLTDITQVFYPDKDVYTSQQSVSNTGTVAFTTAADNMLGMAKEEITWRTDCAIKCTYVRSSTIDVSFDPRISRGSVGEAVYTPYRFDFSTLEGGENNVWKSYFWNPTLPDMP